MIVVGWCLVVSLVGFGRLSFAVGWLCGYVVGWLCGFFVGC